MFKSPTSVVHAHQCVISIEFREEKRKEKKRKEKKRKDYAFWRQFNETPSVVPGCPDIEFRLI